MERGVAEAKLSANGRFFKLYFIHAASPCTVAPDIHVVRFVSIPTWYVTIVTHFEENATGTGGFI
jgi:hypothetical protein